MGVSIRHARTREIRLRSHLGLRHFQAGKERLTGSNRPLRREKPPFKAGLPGAINQGWLAYSFQYDVRRLRNIGAE